MTPRPAQSRRAKARAFTLIEALTALLLVGVVLPVALRGVTVAMQSASRAKHVAEATELARHKLSELSLSTDAGSLTGNGGFDDDHPGYTWSCTSTARDYGMTEFTVTVKWQAQGVEQSVDLSSFFYVPDTTSTTAAGTTAGGTTQ